MAEGRRTSQTRRVSTRYYEVPYGYGYSGYNGACGFGGLFRAAAQAAAELLVGSSRVASNFLIDASDQWFGGPMAADYEYEYEDEGAPVNLEDAAAQPGGPVEYEEEIRYVAPGGAVCDTVDRAFVDETRVVNRAAQRFADEVELRRPLRRRRVRIVRERVGTAATVERQETVTTATAPAGAAPGTPKPTPPSGGVPPTTK